MMFGSLLSCLTICSSVRLVAGGDDGHARKAGIVRRPDVERVNVVAAPAEQPGHAREHAELVLDEN